VYRYAETPQSVPPFIQLSIFFNSIVLEFSVNVINVSTGKEAYAA
jgi:hypothetical protein